MVTAIHKCCKRNICRYVDVFVVRCHLTAYYVMSIINRLSEDLFITLYVRPRQGSTFEVLSRS